RRERKRSRAERDALLLQLAFGPAHPRDFRRRIDDPWNGVEVDVTVLSRDALGDRDPFVFGLVREHWPAHHVADRPDVRKVRPAIAVDGHEPARAETGADGFGNEAQRR